jgi:hypothetical protein
MILIQTGDRLPIVAAVQHLLNARLSGRRPLRVDGDFGRQTREAVIAFQDRARFRRSDGIVGPITWERLTSHNRLKVRDVVDVFDQLLLESQRVVESTGSRPIVIGGGSNAVGWIAPSVASSGVNPGSLVLLRFHGHGNRGTQVVGYGTGVHVLYDVLRREPVPPLHGFSRRAANVSPEEDRTISQVTARSAISLRSLMLPDVVAALSPLRAYFAASGSVEFHGCQVGGGVEGQQFLQQVAGIFGVPAVAGQRAQTTGNAIRFRGPIRIACPRGVSLREWARGLPAVLASSV